MILGLGSFEVRMFLGNLRSKVRARPPAEVRALVGEPAARIAGAPAGFEVSINHMHMVNGTVISSFEAESKYLGGAFYRRLWTSLEVDPSGAWKENPFYEQIESARQRKRRREWLK